MRLRLAPSLFFLLLAASPAGAEVVDYPIDLPPGEVAYRIPFDVRYPGTDLLDIVALESARAGAEIVGEDLGTVEDEVRAQLAERAVLSCRVVWFEPGPPESFPEQALASVSTHDLPTIPGVWTGADLADQQQAGLDPNEDGLAGHRSLDILWTHEIFDQA